MELFKGRASSTDQFTSFYEVQASCRYEKGRCLTYTIPVDISTAQDLYFFAWLSDKTITGVRFYAINTRPKTDNEVTEIAPQTYVVGVDARGSKYIVVKGLQSIPFDFFGIQVKITYSDGSVDFYNSQEFEYERNAKFDTVSTNYQANANGGYDGNGFYIGLPASAIFGNANLRYYHVFPLRGLSATYSGKKITFTSLDNARLKNSAESTYTIHHEAIPYWYEELTAQAFGRGIISIDGLQYAVSDYSSQNVGDEYCERMATTIRATKVRDVAFGCSSTTTEEQSALPNAPALAVRSITQCLDAPVDLTVGFTGTSPITATVINANGLTVTFNGTTINGSIDAKSMTIRGQATESVSVQVRLSNSIGVVTETYNIIAGPCCEFTGLSYTLV